MLLAILLLMWAGKKAIGDAVVDNNYAKQGLVSPRMQAKYGDREAAAKVAKYGFFDYLRDSYRDSWARATDSLIASRDAKAEAKASGEPRVRFRDRLTAGRDAIVGGVQQVVASGPVRRLVDPVPPHQRQDELARVDQPDVDETPMDTPVGTRRLTDRGWEEWDGSHWRPAPEPKPEPTPEPAAGRHRAPTRKEPVVTAPTAAPTGEAANYETAIATLEALAVDQRAELDAAIAAEAAAAALKEAVDQMQQTYQHSSDTASSTHDQLSGMNLDGTTLAHTGTTADALPAGRVDAMFDNVEDIEAVAKERREAAEVALAETEAAIDHLRKTYGDAHETVAGNLSGDSRFLDSGVGATGVGSGGEVRNNSPYAQGANYSPTASAGTAAPAGSQSRVGAMRGANDIDAVNNRLHGAADNATS